MTNASPTSNLSVTVDVSAEVVCTSVHDARVDTVTLFGRLDEHQQCQLATDAWSIGLRALANAHAQAQEARLEDVGQALIEDIDRHLRAHVESQQQTIAAVLSRFFDPEDGQVTQHLSAFVADQGVLARLLDGYLGPKNSVLMETLARQVGETSALFKKLSPTDSEGLVKVLEGQLGKVMGDGQAALLRALDPMAEDSAVARFLHCLQQDLKAVDETRAEKLSTALMALDANDESSLINKLVRETNSARQAVLQAVNPDAADSPMASIKQTLTTMLKAHAESQAEATRLQQERQERFEKEVREALVRMEAKRGQDQVNPRGGFDFEDAVVEFVTGAIRGAPCLADATGNTAGVRSRCKKGDLVVRFTDESAFEGVAVVFEAKRDASFGPQKALAELDEARANRKACAGVLVMAKSHAPEGFPTLARHGNNVLVVWDDQNRASDPYLHAAVLLGLGLAVRARNVGDEGDIDALRGVEGRIEDEVRRLQRMEKHNDAIRKNCDGIGDEIRKAQQQLQLLVRDAKSTLAALNIRLVEEEAERGSPILLPPGSLASASESLERVADAGAPVSDATI